MTLSEYKNEFSDREGIHFNNAGMAPISRRVASRLATMTTQLQTQGSRLDREWIPEIKEVRQSLAQLIGADRNSIAFTQNCASALSQAALGYPLKRGDRVVTLTQEYSSNYYPWEVACKRSKAELYAVPSDENRQIRMERLLDAIQVGTKLVGVSWVQFQTGACVDLQALGDHCRGVGARLIVDGIQGIGQLPINFNSIPVDCLVGGSHKWLCGIGGQGFMAIKPDFLEELTPVVVGSGTFNRFGTYADPHEPMERTARRFEAGGFGYLPLFALGEAVKLQAEVGIETIEAEIKHLSQILRTGLERLRPKGVDLVTPHQHPGGITSFRLPIDTEVKFLRRCQDEQVALAKRSEFIRISLHAFCEEREVETVLEILEGVL